MYRDPAPREAPGVSRKPMSKVTQLMLTALGGVVLIAIGVGIADESFQHGLVAVSIGIGGVLMLSSFIRAIGI